MDQSDAEIIALHRLEYLDAEASLEEYTKSAWHVLEPATELLWGWHHSLICEHLEAIAAGQLQNLIINIAPRSTKSILATICYPTWRWIKKPSRRFLFGSYADTLATKQSVLRRNILESAWYTGGYGDRFQLASDANTKSEFSNNKTGQMRSGGITSPPMGEGGDEIIIDDPHNTKTAESEPEREKALYSFDHGWSTRLNNKRTGSIIVIMQRLHENDLTGHLLEKDLGYTHLKIPSICEERTRIVFPVSKRVIVREAGDIMHPEREGTEELARARKVLGPYGFSGQHQQSPVPSTGGLFNTGMFEYGTMPERFDYVVVTADTAYNDKKENDFTVFTAGGVVGDQLYVLDVWREQIKSIEVEAKAIAFIKKHSKYGFRGAYIEPKGHGIYLNQALPRKGIMVPAETTLKEFFQDRRMDKVERANNAVPHLTNRKVIINENLNGKEELVAECLSFPKGRHDDFVDTLVDLLKYVYGRTYSMFDVQ